MSVDIRSGEHWNELTGPQKRAIEALAAGATKEQAAEIADRTPHTLRRWERDDTAYQAALQAASDAVLKDAALRLKGMLDEAITAVERRVLKSKGATTSDTLRAFDLLAKYAVRLAQHQELEERVQALEEKLNDS